MKFLKFFLALLITAGFNYLMNTSNPFGIDDLPALGKLMSPFQGFWQNAKIESEKTYKKQKLKGLKETVTVKYDERLVPHIFAQNLDDLCFAQGYVTAQHRLWQMDVSTRAAGGRLSEVLGKRTIELDREARRRGMVVAAERAVESWKLSKNYHLLEAYVAGVNAFISALSPDEYPVEFKLLGYAPEEWSVLKTALFQKVMALDLNFGHQDIRATNALEIFGEETFNFLYPEINPEQSPIIPVGTAWKTDSSELQVADTSEILLGDLSPYPQLKIAPPEIGSNNWAVAGSKTANGHPILCSDPHLSLTLPSIWYEMQLNAPGLNAYGVTLPGVAFVIIGFNENIAWGETNVGQDVVDWYELEWIDKAKTVYRYDEEARKVEQRVETIKVKGEKTVIDTVRWTHYGPIMYESDNSEYKDLAMRWLSLEAPNPEEFTTFLKLNQASNYDDYSEALKSYEVPAQNFVFASKEGDIALKVNGKFPKKQPAQGRFILDGSKSQNEWQGFVPMEEVPQVKNPPRGFVASSNQRSTDETYPYYYHSESFDAYRGRFINRTLEEMDSITVQDMMDLQTSSKSLFAEEALPKMLEFLDRSKLSSVQSGLIKILEDWDFYFRKDEVAPVLFTEWADELYRLLWDEVSAQQAKMEVLSVRDWKTVEMMTKNTLNVFWDKPETPNRETPTDIATEAFINSTNTLQEELQGQGQSYTWKEHRGTYIAHLSRSIEPFGRYDIPSDGYRKAPNAIGKTTGPSWRMVVELGEEIKAYGVYPGGQSGNPGSPYYDDMIDQWIAGEYYELFFMKDEDDNRQPILFNQQLKSK